MTRRRDPRTPRSFAMGGGLDLITPHMKLAPGSLIAGTRNYEVALGGGYRRVDGYERFDGRAKPSTATYSRIPFTGASNRVIQPYDIITGVTSGVQAVVVATPAFTSGDWTTNDGAGELSFTLATGTFNPAEAITVSGIVVCQSAGAQFAGSIGDADYKVCLRGTQMLFRFLIQAVPGVGNVLGVWDYNATVYALRNNGGATAAVLYKATAGGWSAVPLGSYLRFNGGFLQINEGDTITGGTSGATALVQRVNVGSGTWQGPTLASGRFAITTITGTFTNGEVLKVGGVTKAICIGTQATNVFLPGGRFEFANYNFYGATNKKRMYGVDGVNRGFEFDGTVFCFIETGMAIDTPTHIATHKYCLFFAFPGGSLQNSGVTVPLNWSPRLGADEIGIGDDISCLYSIKDDVLGIWGRNTIGLLYGSSNANWSLQKHADRIGALPYSVQEIDGQVVFLDNRGMFDTTVALNAGDFEDASQSHKIKPLMIQKALLLTSSALVREKSQVRLFFSDKTALTCTFVAGQVAGWVPQTYQHQFVCCVSGEDATGAEVIYAGGDDGFVYQLNSGTSFDGVAVDSLMPLPYYDYGTPINEKHFHQLRLLTDAPRAFNITLLTEFDFGGAESALYAALSARATGGQWDQALWNNFFWDGVLVSTPIAEIDGWGVNMSPTLYHSDDIDPCFTISAATVLYSTHGIRT